jgi:hypothetical protein
MISDPVKRVLVQIPILFCFIFYLATDISHAGALLYRIKQKQIMKQRAYQEYLQHQQQHQQKGAAVGEGQQPSQQPETYQQKVDRRNQAIAQAILDAHQKTNSSEIPFGNEPAETQPPAAGPAVQQPQQATSEEAPLQASEEVDLSEVWKKLDKKSTIWRALADDQAKALTVSEYLNRFHDEGVKISQPPVHYVQMIDQMTKQTPQMLEMPFGELLKIMAIIDYDFDNGLNKDDLARKVLGDAGFEVNKKRFTQQ